MPKDSAPQEALYAEIAREYGPALGRVASAYEANSQQRQDLLQDIHLAIWRSLAVFDDQCSIRTWIYRVAHNTAFSHIARDRRRGASRLCALEEIGDTADPHDSDADTNRQQVVERLHELISRLQPLDRQIIMLYLEDVDAASIATITGFSPGNVATKIHRIKTLLARRLHAGEIRDA